MSSADEPYRGDRIPVRSNTVAWQTIDGETVLLRIKEKELLGLNEVAHRIWELADGTRSIDQIIEAIAAEYRVPADMARVDSVRFIQEMASLGALDLRPD
jgi:coenzyme PQQ synthesis protein D (PqqD)